MLRIVEAMPLARIYDKFRLHSQRVQGMPELVGLRHRAFPIALAYRDQRRGFHIFDVSDRRASRVYCRLVIYRRAEVRQHPLVDGIFAIITLQNSDPSAGECRPETIGL